MKAIKYRKVTDKDNCLGYEKIEIVAISLWKTEEFDDGTTVVSSYYLWAICDGRLEAVGEDDWSNCCHAYVREEG
jgi:hypothetical protein